jgi:asparagine synthase (glutamine-hydrolysing)
MVIDVESNGVTITNPADRSWQVTADATATDPKDFQRVLSRHLDTFIATRLEGNNVAFEVSAGIDSSLLPLYYKSKMAASITTGTMVFPGEYKQSQLAKRNLIQLGESAVSVPVDPKTDYPLSRFMKTTARPFYSFEEIYAEPLDKLAIALADRGIEVVSTGIGGDELFENNVVLEDEFRFGQATMAARADTALPSYFTDTFQKKWIASAPAEMPYAVPLLGMSLHGAQLARNASYIAHDIWPVSPFANSQLYEFCQGLPVIFRSNKNILRAYYDAHSFPAEISNPAVNENFGRFFDDCLSSGIYDHIVATYAAQSVAEQWGYIDAKVLLQQWQQKGDPRTDPATKQLLFSVFTWLSLEMNIAAA